MTAPRFYAIRQTRRPRLIGSQSMTRAQADREVAVWSREIGPAVVVPVTPESAAAVRAYDQAALAALMTEHAPKIAGPPYIGRGQQRTPAEHRPMPEHVDDGIVLVDVYSNRDDFGRVRFFAYWADDIRWRGGGMVAGQVFHTRLEEFADRERQRGRQVLVMTDDGNVPLEEVSS